MRVLTRPVVRSLVLCLLAAVPLCFLLGGCSEDSASTPSNSNPVIASVTVAPGSTVAGGTVTVSVSASDPDGDSLSYSYTPTGGAINGSGAVVTWTAPATAGAYSVNVTVTDGNGGSASSSGSLNVSVAPTQIIGTVALPGGVPGNLANGVVSIYLSWADWNSYTPAMSATVIGTGASVTYTLSNVPAGAWYIDYWLDSNFNFFWDTGDFVAWHGSGTWGAPTLTPFTINDGQTLPINMTAVLIP